MSAGKGSTPRKVDCGKYAVNYEKIFSKTEVHICRKDEPVEIPAEESEQPVETEYRFLEVGELIQESDQFYAQSIDQWLFTNIGHMSHHNTEACKYRRKVEPVETEYRFLKEGELIQEGDEYWCCGDWRVVYYNEYGLCTVAVPNFYRRKDERKQECTCGRIKINHHTLGWICEDCEWHGEPY
jgi:hypothetical protein